MTGVYDYGSGFAEWTYNDGSDPYAFGNPFASGGGYDPFTTIGSGGGMLDNWGDLFGSTGGVQIQLPGGGGGSGPDVHEQLTAIVNAAERALQANLADWQQGRVSATVAVQRGWELMNRMVSDCARYGEVGMNSAAERDRRIDPTRLRWDWIAYYIDPITGGPSQPATLPGVVTGGSSFTPPGTGPINPSYTEQGVNAYLWAGVAAVVLLLVLARR